MRSKSKRQVVGTRRPVLDHYPHFADYATVGEEYRPFVGFVHRAGYRSPSVNTDGLGLREHYDADGRFIDLTEPATIGPACNVLLGGSAAFGVGATNDRATIAARLNDPDMPCLNLGVCAGSSQQELALYLVLKRRLPRVRNAILLSGFNECVLAASDHTVVFPEYGGSFVHKARVFNLDTQVLANPRDYVAQRWLHAVTDRVYWSSRGVRGLARLATRVAHPHATHSPRAGDWSFKDRLRVLLAHVEGNIETWGALQHAGHPRVHYILQPVATWADRELTPREQELIAAHRAQIPGTAAHATLEVRGWLRETIASACTRAGIAFHDASDWLAHDDFRGVEVFVDHCHLTDTGNALLARHLRAELEWA